MQWGNEAHCALPSQSWQHSPIARRVQNVAPWTFLAAFPRTYSCFNPGNLPTSQTRPRSKPFGMIKTRHSSRFYRRSPPDKGAMLCARTHTVSISIVSWMWQARISCVFSGSGATDFSHLLRNLVLARLPALASRINTEGTYWS